MGQPWGGRLALVPAWRRKQLDPRRKGERRLRSQTCTIRASFLRAEKRAECLDERIPAVIESACTVRSRRVPWDIADQSAGERPSPRRTRPCKKDVQSSLRVRRGTNLVCPSRSVSPSAFGVSCWDEGVGDPLTGGECRAHETQRATGPPPVGLRLRARSVLVVRGSRERLRRATVGRLAPSG